MLGNHHPVGDDAHLRGRGAGRYHTAGEFSRNAVAIAVEYHEAGVGNPHHVLDIPIEDCSDAAQAILLLREAGGDGTLWGHWMFARGEFPASLGQPFVQCLEAGKLGQRCEQPFADIADLVFDLAFLPA